MARCRSCGLVYLDGDRSPQAEHRQYQCDHFEADGYLTRLSIEEIVAEQLTSLRSILRRAGASLDDLPADAGILEIGCARGHLLHRLARETGRTDLVGIDVSREMVERGRAEFGLDLRALPVEEINFPPGRFGLIILFDVLEHVARPREVLARLLRLLRPGGWLVFEVPSEDTLFRRLVRLGYRLSPGRFSAAVAALYHPAHLSYFTRRSLSRLVAGVGGERLAIATKEAHVTRFGLGRYGFPARAAIRAVATLDRLLGSQAKLLGAFRCAPGSAPSR